MTGAAPSFATGQARNLPAQIGEMQMIVADPARPPDPWSPITRRCLDHANGRMPVDVDDPFALPPFNQHVIAMHRSEERQSLHPIDDYPQSVIVAQIIELCSIFALDGGNPHGLALAVGLGLFAG